jgi:hypothetical protein
MEEIPAMLNRMEIFMEQISYVITSAGSPMHCNDVAPPRHKLGGKWYCTYPELRECHDPTMLSVDEVQTKRLRMNDLGLGKANIRRSSWMNLPQFKTVKEQDRGYLAKAAELAYNG